MPSFDVVSEVDMQEVRNAVDQAQPRDRDALRLQGHRQRRSSSRTKAIELESASEERLEGR